MPCCGSGTRNSYRHARPMPFGVGWDSGSAACAVPLRSCWWTAPRPDVTHRPSLTRSLARARCPGGSSASGLEARLLSVSAPLVGGLHPVGGPRDRSGPEPPRGDGAARAYRSFPPAFARRCRPGAVPGRRFFRRRRGHGGPHHSPAGGPAGAARAAHQPVHAALRRVGWRPIHPVTRRQHRMVHLRRRWTGRAFPASIVAQGADARAASRAVAGGRRRRPPLRGTGDHGADDRDDATLRAPLRPAQGGRAGRATTRTGPPLFSLSLSLTHSLCVWEEEWPGRFDAAAAEGGGRTHPRTVCPRGRQRQLALARTAPPTPCGAAAVGP